jgi:hypothetical protein
MFTTILPNQQANPAQQTPLFSGCIRAKIVSIETSAQSELRARQRRSDLRVPTDNSDSIRRMT